MTTTIDNYSLPADTVRKFIVEAKNAGCYTPLQARLVGVAFKKLLGLVPDAATMTVGELAKRRESILQDPSVTPSSARTYLSRVTKLFEDFARWYRRDLSQWRTVQEREAAETAANRQQALFTAASAPSSTDRMAVYPIRLPTNRLGELRLPMDLNQAELAAVVKQIQALLAVLKAQMPDSSEAQDD